MATVRIISRDNGVGLSRDMQLVAGLMRDAGHVVDVMGYGGHQLANRWRETAAWARRGVSGPVDLQVFLERVYKRCLPLARRNVLVPNPEWFSEKWLPLLPAFDRVLCKTRHAVDVFARLGCDARFTGFTSDDLYDPGVAKERAFFHLAGRSIAKGTRAVIAAWERHPEWPRLTVVQHPRMVERRSVAANVDHRVGYVDAAELRRLQNRHWFHLCPSETEGFGHYLVEAMGVGAVLLATDGAPMNEMVDAQTGLLVPAARRERRGLVEHFLVDEAGIEQAVARALALDEAGCRRIGAAARAAFLERDRRFRAGFADACFDR